MTIFIGCIATAIIITAVIFVLRESKRSPKVAHTLESISHELKKVEEELKEDAGEFLDAAAKAGKIPDKDDK